MKTTLQPNKLAQELRRFYQNHGSTPTYGITAAESKLAQQYASTRKSLWKAKGNLNKMPPSTRNTVEAAPEMFADITDYFEAKKGPEQDLWFLFPCFREEIREEEEKLAALGERLIELAHAHAVGQACAEDFAQAKAQLEEIHIPEGIPGMIPSLQTLDDTDSLLQVAHLLLAGADALRTAMRLILKPDTPSVARFPHLKPKNSLTKEQA